MGDTTTLWTVELYEIYRHTGDILLVQQLWPAAARAFYWAINNAGAQGIPQFLTCTYDHFGFEQEQVRVSCSCAGSHS